MSITSEELKNLLINNQLITEKEFQKVAKEAERTEKNVIDLLIANGYITSDYYADLLAQYLKVPRVKILGRTIEKKF